MHSHFEGKDALTHVKEKQAEGVTHLNEAHGMEAPGPLFAACDAARDTAFLCLLLSAILLGASLTLPLSIFFSLIIGWVCWKAGRSAWLGWSKLERLHTIIEQEKYEIEHHRPQEKEELIALYREKGFEGKLLEEVVAVLMADQDRLLKVMLEEELGIRLELFKHPLIQSFGAFIGSLITFILILAFYFFFEKNGMVIASLVMIACSAGLISYYEKNRLIPSIVWNCAIGILGAGLSFCILKMLL